MRKFTTNLIVALVAILLPRAGVWAQEGLSTFAFSFADAPINLITMSYNAADGIYDFNTTGGDPYVFTNALTGDLSDEANTLSFEYNCPQGVSNVQIFFADPVTEANSAKNLEIPATGQNEWKTYTLDITEYRSQFSWGYTGNRMRIDFGTVPGVNIKVRNLRVSSPKAVLPVISLNTESDVNMMDVSYDAAAKAYSLTTTGGDPHINTTKLEEALTSEQNILTFEYNAPTGVNDIQIFFCDPTAEARSAKGLQLDATAANEWKTFQLNIEQSRSDFNWGNAGDYLRLDFGGTADVSFKLRNLNIITPGEVENLQDYLDGLKYGIDDYVNGPNPGCIGDTAIFSEFDEAYNNAMQLASSATATDAEKVAALNALKSAKNKIDEAVNPIPDGLYFIETAYSVFEGKDTMAWFSPRQANQPGWKKKAESVLFLWNIKKLDDGNYSIQNYGTGQYVNHNATVDGANQPLLMSDNQETAQVIDMIKPNGQFNIHSLGARWAYNIQGHNAGEATEGPISNWTAKGADLEGAWKIIPVTEAELAVAQTTQNRDLLTAAVTTFTDDYAIGTDPGYYSQDAHDAYVAEYNAAKAVTDNAEALTEETAKAALDKYNAAKAALDASTIGITDGYYTIMQKPYDESLQSPGLAWSLNGTSGYPYSFIWENSNPNFIWQIKNLGNNRYSIQSYESKEYLGSADLLQEGASINLTKTQTTPQLFISQGNGAFKMSNTVITSKGLNYVFEPNNYVWLQVGGSNVYLHKYTDAEVADIAATYPQKLRNDTLNDLVALASLRTQVDSVYTADTTAAARIITDKSQLFITNQSTEGADLGRLLDNDSTTHCISAYNTAVVAGTEANDYHAIRIDAGEGKTLPRNLALWWRTRNSDWRNMYRPIDVRFYASNDLQTWDFIEELSNPQAEFPVTAAQPFYLSPRPIVLNKPYRYLNMKIIDTNTHSVGYNGYKFFTFSEFNAYPMTAALDETIKNNPDLANALEGLRAAIKTAEPKVEAGNVTSQDIADFRVAYNEFLLNWKDTTDLYRMYATAEAFAPTVVAGEDMFCYPDEQVAAFEEAYAEVDAARPFTNIDQHEVARLDTLLTRAYNNLLSSMIGPEPGVWYSVYSMDETKTDNSGNPIKNQVAWMGGNSAADGLGCSGDKETARLTNPTRAWKFEPTGTPNVYNMICAGNGWPINRGPVRLAGLGDGQFAIYTGGNLDQAYYILPAVLPGVPSAGVTPVKDGTGAWAMEPAPEELSNVFRLNQGRVMSVVFPYDLYEVPFGLNGEPVQTYSVCGYEVAADGKTITGINLAEWTEEGIKAGTPFVFTVDGDEAYNADSLISVNFPVQVNGPVSREITPQNGLFGTFSNITVPAGMIYFLKDSAFVEPDNYSIGIQRTYLDVNSITIDPSKKVAKTVPVNGIVSTTVGIKSAVSGKKSIVDVYTTDGVLIRKGVKASEAKNGLAKGVYIIGKEKVLVK